MKVNEIEIPNYTEKEDNLNSITHGLASVGFLLLSIPLLYHAIKVSYYDFICVIIYVLSLVGTLLISGVYHGLPNSKYKKIFRILDHSSIYLLIAGTYTPFTLIALKDVSVFSLPEGVFGIIIFALVWIISITGIILNYIDLKKFLKLSIFLYLLEGWCIIFAFKSIYLSIGPLAMILLLSGGIVYSIGVIFYSIGKKIKYIHTVFHIFVVIASLLMFLSVYFII
ncbi:MAG: hemolysin III family protein [Bacilli bacterium]